jgi:hypothetical protein
LEQHRLDELFTAALNAALDRLESEGVLNPLAYALGSDGNIYEASPGAGRKRPGGGAALKVLKSELRALASAGEIAASALARQHEDGRGELAVAVHVRAPEGAFDMIVPYKLDVSGIIRRTRKAEPGEARAHEVRNDIFV